MVFDFTPMTRTLISTDLFGEEVTYTPAGGDPVAITAAVKRNPVEVVSGANGEVEIRSAVLLADGAEVAAPGSGDKFSFPEQVGGTPADWIYVTHSPAGTFWNIEVSRTKRTTLSAADRRADPAG